MLGNYVSPAAVVGDSRESSTDYIRTKNFTPNTMLAHLRRNDKWNQDGTRDVHKELKAVPQDKVRNFRNDMYVVSEALRLMQKSGNPKFSVADTTAVIKNYKGHIDGFLESSIPGWVKVAVALALRTWHDDRMEKRIVVTVGEKKNRQGSPHVRPGRRRGNYGDVYHRRRRLVRSARQYHARAVVWSCRNNGSQ